MNQSIWAHAYVRQFELCSSDTILPCFQAQGTTEESPPQNPYLYSCRYSKNYHRSVTVDLSSH